MPQQLERKALAVGRAGQFERQRQHRRPGAGNAGNARPAILAHGPDFGAGRTQLERGEPARQHAVDAGPGERQVDGPQLEERVSETDEAVAVAVGESADGDGAEIAAYERDAQRRPRLHGAGISGAGRSSSSRPQGGCEAVVSHEFVEHPRRSRREAAQREGSRQRLERARMGFPVPPATPFLESGLIPILPARLETALHHRQHVGDRGDSADRLLRKRPAERNRSQQPPVDVDGTAAHAANHSGLLESRPRQAGEDEVLPGTEAVALETDDLDAEGVDGGSAKDG